MRRRGADLTIAGVLVALGLAMAAQALSYRVFAAGGRIGPGFMPFVAGLALAAFSAWAGAQILVQGRRDAHRVRTDRGAAAATGVAPSAGAAQDVRVRGSAERRVGLVFLLSVGAVLLAYATGFLVAFGLLVFALLAVVEREAYWLAAVITVTAVALCYLVFVVMLQVPLPGGPLGLLGTA